MLKHGIFLICLLLILGCSHESAEMASAEISRSSGESRIETAGPLQASEPPQTSFSSSQSSGDPAPDSPTLAECGLQPIETLEVYRFWGDGEIYSHERIAFEGEQTLLAMIDLAASSLPFADEPLPVLGVTRERGFVTVDLSREFIDRFSKGEIFELLNTVSMTLMQNGAAGSFRYTVEGETGLLGDLWQVKPLAVAQEKPEEYAKICASIPYPGMAKLYFPTAGEITDRFGVAMDETAMEIARLLARVGKMERDAASPQELEPSRLYLSCVWNTPAFYTVSGEENYEPGLIPIADSVSAKLGMSESMFWIGEHIRQTARILCGDDFELDLAQGEGFKYRYFPLEGVITPPHMGGGYDTIPLVLSYEETEGGFCAEVVYLFESMGGIGPWGMERTLTEEELPGYVADKAQRAEVEVRRAKDGRLCFGSFHTKTNQTSGHLQ